MLVETSQLQKADVLLNTGICGVLLSSTTRLLCIRDRTNRSTPALLSCCRAMLCGVVWFHYTLIACSGTNEACLLSGHAGCRKYSIFVDLWACRLHPKHFFEWIDIFFRDIIFSSLPHFGTCNKLIAILVNAYLQHDLVKCRNFYRKLGHVGVGIENAPHPTTP